MPLIFIFIGQKHDLLKRTFYAYIAMRFLRSIEQEITSNNFRTPFLLSTQSGLSIGV